MRLLKHERCPIHKRFVCPCKPAPEPLIKRKLIKGGVEVARGVVRIPCDWHEGGFCERRNKQAMRKLVLQKIVEQGGSCPPKEKGGCGEAFVDISEVEGDHINGRRPNRCDCAKCIQAMHRRCNHAKGSRKFA